MLLSLLCQQRAAQRHSNPLRLKPEIYVASPSPLSKEQRVIDILREAKRLAREYYQLTKKPLGITGEIAEFEAHQLLDNVELTPARQAGYDAIEHTADGDRYLQIKGRCVLPNSRNRGKK